MVARFHYDDSMILRLVRDQLPAEEEQKVTTHVEECPICQAKMESVTEAGISWNDVRRFLDPGSLNEGRLSGCPLASETTGPCNEERAIDFLAPSEAPQSLGRFGRYEITEILGRGGMGVVMRGYDPALDRHSAIKVLAPELATSAAARQRFSREARSAAAVVHDHVIPIQTVDEERGLPYLVMPVVEGKSLEQRLADEGPLPVVEILRVGMQIASGLATAHAQGLVHRDIKPANILLDTGVERVMITDFGLARAADDANMTRSGVIAGTPQYMSPEQARGKDVDHRSDLFSLGSVLYFMCTGRPPFRAETMMGVLSRIANDKPRALRKINTDVPVWLSAIIDRLLDKDREQRFQSASEVADLLEECLAHVQQPAAAPLPHSLRKICFQSAKAPRRQARGLLRRKNRLWRGVLITAAVFGIALFGTFLWQSTHPAKTQPIAAKAANRSPSPKGVHVGRNERSVMVVHDDVDLQYVFYHAGDFGTSSSGTRNTESLTSTDEGSITLKDGTTFGYRRKSVNPFHLHVNGKEYDLRQGRVFQLTHGGSVEQLKLFPSLSDARGPDTLAKLIASTRAMHKGPITLEKLRQQLAAAQSQLRDLQKTHAPTHSLVVGVSQHVAALQRLVIQSEPK